ncbi:MAG: DUF2061 domain-containing protein [Verrucomicrobiota bacterium]|jgi:uncharacterized membrane protein|nr:DUF2061 domain-containing protein [Verrucomicrobiota bacterium]|tara:strand:- start:452 stop:712 length:261 start_codon:yes stop_codon:yes gene_type:complete
MKNKIDQLLTESPLRSAAKGLTWRLVATFTTILIVYFMTGEQDKALLIGAIEFVTKFFVYYIHERAWVRISFGKCQAETAGNPDFS